MDVVGVGGARGGWVAIRLADSKLAEARFFKKFRDLVQAYSQATVIAVDVPIGLPDRNRRAADERPREVLGDRRSSVFFAPPRAVLEAKEFSEAVQMARHLASAVSKQSYALGPKIFEVGRFASDPRIVEIHPEVSFWAMNGRRPLPYAKNTWNGLMMRLELLRAHGLELPRAIEGVGKVSANDIVDAAAAAWSAWRVARGQAGSLPDPPEVRPAGRTVAIRY